MFRGRHSLTLGGNFETFSFFNSFNIFRHGVFQLPVGIPTGTTFGRWTSSSSDRSRQPGPERFQNIIGTGPFKGENIDVGQLGFYAQDELLATDRFNLTFGVRVDFPMYFTDPVDNPFSRSLTALDENGNPETVDQSDLPGAKPLSRPASGSTGTRMGTGGRRSAAAPASSPAGFRLSGSAT